MANKDEDTSEGHVAESAGVSAGSLQAGSELLQNADLYETLISAHPDGIVLTIDGKIVLVNERAAEMSGYSTEEVIGMAPAELIVPEERERANGREQDLLKNGSARPSRYLLLRKDGTQLPMDVHSRLLRHDGKAAIISIVRDITDRKQAEEELRAFEKKRYDHLLEEVPDGIVIVAAAGVIQTVNARTEELFGYDRNELIGSPIEMLVPERFRQGHTAHRQAFTASPHARVMGPALELCGLRKDGSEFPLDVNLNAMPADAGNSVIATVRDMTEYVEAERALRESEARFSTAFHDNPIPVVITRVSDGKLVDMNDAFLSMTEFRRSETTGRTSAELGLLVDAVEPEILSHAVRERGTVRDFPGRIRKKAGDLLDVLGTATLIELEGEPCLLITIVDITERKRLEEELQEMRDDLESKVERQMDRGNVYKLTFREFTVLHLISAGKADKEIAAELAISVYTVHRHVSKILAKMDSPSRTEAGTRALREGVLE